MLYGEYQHNMDAKGRVTVPAKFREDLGDRFYVCKGLDNCLFMLSEEGWTAMMNKISALPASQSTKLQRFFFAGAAEAEADKQGRILLPQSLRDYAGLTRETTVVGLGTRAEIWDTEKWNAYMASQSDEDIRDALEGLVL
ncbi:MAG: division/cell wall cluster transcriptional repressor MraZ [Clostridia bacterium]|nr:division/cell wall cluster transcriptional repressor MraZ [Clostridia bacterium]